MKKHLVVRDQSIPYTLRRNSRARSLRLTVHADGSVVMTTPSYLPEFAAERFIRAKAAWLIAKLAWFKHIERRLLRRSDPKEYAEHKVAALTLAEERVQHFNQHYGLSFGRVSVKNQKSRWGSCSKLGNLNFNYKIVLLPSHLADYIIVHELCHLKEFNHSRAFWNLVAHTIPDHAARRKALRAL